MSWTSLLCFVAALEVACGSQSPKLSTTHRRSAAPGTLPEGIYDLGSLRFDEPSAGLSQLSAILRDVEVVSLGETVHYSEGYARARARVIRHLVANLGYRAIAFESAWSDTAKTDAYVRGEAHDLYQAMRGLTFGAWVNEPTRQLITWLREWNDNHPPEQQVRIFGMDIQDVPASARFVRTRLASLPPLPSELGDDLLKHCPGAGRKDYWAAQDEFLSNAFRFPRSHYRACNKVIENIRAALLHDHDSVERALGSKDTALLGVALRSLEAANAQIYFRASSYYLSSGARDAGMADVFRDMRALLAPGKKTVVVAHNAHIRTRSTDLAGMRIFKSVGTCLSERLGGRYAAIGLFASSVSWNWGNRSVFRAHPQAPLSIERKLARLHRNHLLLDLWKSGGDDGFAPFDQVFEMGHGNLRTRGIPSNHFRAIVYLAESPPVE